jgi:hypothetical protein
MRVFALLSFYFIFKRYAVSITIILILSFIIYKLNKLNPNKQLKAKQIKKQVLKRIIKAYL